MGDGERDEREREKEQSVSTTSKASSVYRVYSTAAGIVVQEAKPISLARTARNCEETRRMRKKPKIP